ncbi:BOP1NT-domain-containing protein [Alternaria alternata]|jgi:ribosome biogenesis protein ERB1|uniref:Ribosome biogenesis protein ERB1 n=2 Tax=Alternaria alternata complex TaxID=187734 RepID=A0A177DS40_ALTAL|nr:BOP1NT-domain-containing protein [Alternaria alternata]XP_051589010.1 Ribosome biogenesis protein erb1 [Alternaria postmessia]RYN49460.1 Ribosome biogenesis protein [Alternaria tenuissima]KAH6838885.1 NUC169 domain-containing protein [Alternaria alternata]KAI5376307.1 Ribosome biogenesis protein erb1 [Alternaria postmessia]OAG21961.1 BOP1NT-domain-containing protein [Alternaria alternata]RYN61073.1 Ribosome biogenesis protein [Alternaria tenuissima]
MSVNPRKRKVVTRPAPEPSESEDELGDGLLEGILSHSEDDSDDSQDEDADTDASSVIEGLSDEDEEEEEDSDSEQIREEMRNLNTSDVPLRKKNGVPTHEMDLDAYGNATGELDDDEDLKPNYTVTTDAHGNTRYIYKEIDPVYESDDSDAEATNTIGNIDLKYYDEYPHIGYDINGKKIMRPAKGEALDALLDSIDIPKGWTGLTDPQTGKPLNLTDEELQVLKKLTRNEVVEDGYDPYPEMVAYFSGHQEIMPLSAAPEPKRRFIPSKHEAKRVMKLVKAIREGRIQPYKAPEEQEEEQDVFTFDVWADEKPRPDNSMHIPAPKLPPPGYEASYHPPPEYLPDKAEEQAWLEQDEEDRETDFLPKDYAALRKVPGYETFVKERFERSLDLYLAPRIRRNRLNIDPESLLPKLPNPEELKPFPTTCAAIFRGQEGRVRCVSIDPNGIFVASGGDDGYVRIWEILTGRQVWNAKLSDEEAVDAVQWRPTKDAAVVAAACGENVYLIVPFTLLSPDIEQASREVLDAGWGYATSKPKSNDGEAPKQAPGKWSRPGARLENKGVLVQVEVRSAVKIINWHRRGDYFATVSPRGQSTAVAIHTVSKHLTQLPFRRLKGIAQTAQFHPSKAIFFVATRNTIRSYDLAKQELVKILQPGAKWISSIDVHPGGDNIIVGTYDKRLLWHDLDLSNKPYKTLRFHKEAIRAVRFHQGGLPLFADTSDDGTIQIFHGKVVGDLMENATIVPLKVLRGHKVKSRLGVMGLDWHPREPWCVSAGADGTLRLWS